MLIKLPEELYESDLTDITSSYDEENECITLSVIPSKYKHELEDVAMVWVWSEKNTYYIEQFNHYLRDKVGNEIINNEVKDVLVNIKNYLDILGFKDTTLDEY